MQSNREKITKYVEKGVVDESSPMDPPDAFCPPATVDVRPEDMAPYLQKLIAEHRDFSAAIEAFESILGSIAEKGVTSAANDGLREFFHKFDTAFMEHHKREERCLFPVLQRRLVEEGEHSRGDKTVTGVDVMVDEHLRAIQLAAVAFNLFGLSGRLPDAGSRLVALDAAIEQGKSLVELLRLHIFREDHIIFPLAHQHIDAERLEDMEGADDAGEPGAGERS